MGSPIVPLAQGEEVVIQEVCLGIVEHGVNRSSARRPRLHHHFLRNHLRSRHRSPVQSIQVVAGACLIHGITHIGPVGPPKALAGCNQRCFPGKGCGPVDYRREGQNPLQRQAALRHKFAVVVPPASVCGNADLLRVWEEAVSILAKDAGVTPACVLRQLGRKDRPMRAFLHPVRHHLPEQARNVPLAVNSGVPCVGHAGREKPKLGDCVPSLVSAFKLHVCECCSPRLSDPRSLPQSSNGVGPVWSGKVSYKV